MKTDDIYKFIGYAVVVVFIIYLISSLFRFQTGVLVEGFKEGNRNRKKKNDGERLYEKCDPDQGGISSTERTNTVNKLKSISNKYNDELCQNFNKKEKYYVENQIRQGINTMFNNCIDHHKILAIMDSINITQEYVDITIEDEGERDALRDEKMEILRAQVENVKALEDCKKYYNDFYGEN